MVQMLTKNDGKICSKMKINQILNHYFFYNLYQDLIGSKHFLGILINDYVKPKQGQKILELGCGAGNVYDVFPEKNLCYIGIDYSKNYISHAKKKFPEQSFICADVTQDIIAEDIFDTVFAEAIISALPDNQIVKMFGHLKNICDDNTKIIFSDMNYRDSAPKFQCFLMKHERNQFIRSKSEYIKLLTDFFVINNISVIKHPYRIPYEKIIFECHLR